MTEETSIPDEETKVESTIEDAPENANGFVEEGASSDEEGQLREDETDPVDPLVALEAENLELKDKLLRTLAEADNTRKRAERQVTDARTYAVEKFARDILGVSDNLSRALTALGDDARAELSEAGKSLLEGIEMTQKDLVAVLARHGVTAIDAVAGVTFDPNVHQAVAQIPSEHPEGTVAEPFQTGWKIGERTLRAAMVAVSTGPSSEM